MTCADIEILLADYLDRTLSPSERESFEAHLHSCADCRAFADDAAGAIAFMERAAVPEPPPELITKLLFEVTSGPSRAAIKPSLARRVFGKLFGRWLEPLLQPRFAMGMAMTVLSIGLMFRATGPLNPQDLDPIKVYHATEDRVARWWDRAVKYYHSLEIVFQIQSRYEEWSRQKAAENPAPTPSGKENSK